MSSSHSEAPLWAVVLAGGAGSRFWPVSTPENPKQLLALAGDRPLISQTVDRILPLIPVTRVRIVTGEALAARIAGAVPEIDSEQVLAEPRPRGTAPALAWAAHQIAARDPHAVMVSLHADHVIAPADAFRALIAQVARTAAGHGRLFTIGVEPIRPETGYGYIRLGPPLEGAAGSYEVAEFTEKPDRETATGYLRRGGVLWNSGIFIWPVAMFLDEIRAHTPEIARLLPLLDQGLTGDFFEQAPSLSVDEGLLERSDRVAVARATFAWDDVGAWDAVGRTRAADEQGNVPVGDAHLVDCQRCIAWAESGRVVAFGARDLVVVHAHGVTLVAPRERAAELKDLLDRLPDRVRRLEP